MKFILKLTNIIHGTLEIFQSLLLLTTIVLALLTVAATAYSIWDLTLGLFGFYVDRNTIAIVTAIGFGSMQLKRSR